jgi:ketosteroid isomerase-like protein
MGASENKELVRKMFAGLSEGPEGFLGRIADDVHYTLIGNTSFSGTFNGKAELIKRLLEPLAAVLETGIALTPYNFIAEGDYVVMQARGKATTKTGKAYNNTYCIVFRIANGKVQEVTEYLDTALVDATFGR